MKSKKIFLAPPSSIKFFKIGYSDLISSLLWIRVVQDIDYCEGGRVVDENDYPERVKEAPSRLQSVLQRKLKPSKCHKGWVYSMLETMTEVEPRFKLAYDVGANFLSIAVDDREGARLIFNKGLKMYPTDWRLNFNASYLYLWELQDPVRAGELMRTAIQNGGPPFLSTLVASIYTEQGRQDLAKIALLEALERNPPDDVKQAILKKMATIDKNFKSP